jgi:hypothetical protein
MGCTVRTEIRGLDLSLVEDFLLITDAGEDVLPPIPLQPRHAELVRLRMSKTLLPEWNQLDELKEREKLRYKRYLSSWLVMCLAAFSAFLSYPEYFLCVALALLSLILWWRAGYMERRTEDEAQKLRTEYLAEWTYLEERLQAASEKPISS